MGNQGEVLLATIACVVVGLIVIVGGINAFLRTESRAQRRQRLTKPFPTGPRQPHPNDQLVYAKINKLVVLFVDKMKHVGYPGLTSQRQRPFEPGNVMRRLQPSHTRVPIEISIASRAWWGGHLNLCSITPDGQWEYFATCESYREGSSDEFYAWWVVSSRWFKQSVAERDPYPFNMYLVLNPGTATLSAALREMAAMMERLLTQHYPAALPEFRALRDR